MRSTAEWIGKTDDTKVPPHVRARIFDRYKGVCYLSNTVIRAGDAWELEHIVPWELTRDDSDENVKPAHFKCHKVKTADDVAAIRKADRVKAKHIGAWPEPRAKIKSRGFGNSRRPA